MPTSWFLAPNGRWSARNLVGNAAVNATLKTYQAGTRIPKATAQSSAGTPLNSTQIQLDSKGEWNIYWADDTLYYIEIFDVSGNLIYSQDNYPIVGSGGNHDITIFQIEDNLVRNGQFTFWDNTTEFTNLGTNSLVADDWYFKRSNTNASVKVEQRVFNLGQTDVDANPIYYLHYECDDVGSGSETYKQITQSYKSVQTLAGRQIAFAIAGKSDTDSTIIIEIEQFFGTGGAPSASVLTEITTIELTDAWDRYTMVATLPNIAGKVLGSDNNDELRLNIKYPLNAIANIDIDNVLLQASNVISDYPIETYEQQQRKIKQLINNALFKTGDFKPTLRDDTDGDEGWVLCNDGTIGGYASNATSRANDDTKALFTLIWDRVSSAFVPIYDSEGVITTRGSTAEEDYNDNKQLALTRMLGRVLASAGEAGLTQTFTVDSTTDIITVANNASLYTGTPITVSTTDTLPAPLAAATTYYVIYIEGSLTTIKLASTRDNALAGTAIDITTSGVGTQSLAYLSTEDWAVGQFTGELQHSLTVAELPIHTHPAGSGASAFIMQGDGGGNTTPGSSIGQYPNTGSAGANEPHNNMQPTTFVNIMLKL